MARAIDVASYIASHKHLSGEVQLQKLMYYAQAWSLVWDGQPLFDEHVEAWKMGPVVPAIRYIEPESGNSAALAEAQKATIDAVIEHYGKLYGTQLINLTHKEAPWKVVWDEHHVGSWCNAEIPHNAMRRFYTNQALENHGPKRRPVTSRATAEADVLAIAGANAQIWSETLEILAG